jgi:hypothetical protein
MDERREKVLSELQRLQEEAQPMLTIVDDLELVKTLQESNSFNMTTLETKHNVRLLKYNESEALQATRARQTFGY